MNRWDSVNVEGSDMPIYVTLPDGGHSHPAIVLTFHRTGLDRFTTESADRLADAGFLTVAPDFYHRHKKLESEEAVKLRMDKEVIADIARTVEHLDGFDNIKTGKMTIMGHCMGGRTAFLGACALPDTFKICVPFYSGGVFVSWGDGPSVFERFTNLKCPVIGFFGNDDENPSPKDVDKFDERLSELSIEHVFYRYDGANHAFQNTMNPSRYKQEQAEDAWQKVITHLSERFL